MANGREPWQVARNYGKWQHIMGRKIKWKNVNEILPVVR